MTHHAYAHGLSHLDEKFFTAVNTTKPPQLDALGLLAKLARKCKHQVHNFTLFRSKMYTLGS